MEGVDIRSHLNAPELRLDTWNSLAALANNVNYVLQDQEKCKSFEAEIKRCLNLLRPIEYYHAFPGVELCDKVELLYVRNEYYKFYELVNFIVSALRSPCCNYKKILSILRSDEISNEEFVRSTQALDHHYFEVLVVEDVSDARRAIIKQEIESYFLPDEKFVYELVFVKSFEDAIIAVTFNFNIRCCLVSDFFSVTANPDSDIFRGVLARADILGAQLQGNFGRQDNLRLASAIRQLRSHDLDIYYLSSSEPEKSAICMAGVVDKIFYDFENYYELHLTIIHGIKKHFETPFFDSLKRYTFEPKSTFHALPVARGKSVFQSKWIREMADFYGKNIFLAESSSTAGGLDSLMNPVGSLKKAMQKAANYFGSHETFFVTNGTSASNKMVLQAVLKPGDIVLVDHTCHESHHYGIVVTGAYPIFMNGFAVDQCDIAGPISLHTIKKHLLDLRRNNMLDRCKMIVLTNCTFDGLVYNTQRYMEEILAIKPDMIFFWDEAWFAYARCVPHYRLRTAMHTAQVLESKYQEPKYREQYQAFKSEKDRQGDSDEFVLNSALLPDPDRVQIRVYSTQSTHKTLSCFRQGSMIHIYDRHFEGLREAFTHAFITHSTTSPNYQILATMDLARRQAEMEGYELVQNAIELSMIFRQQVNKHSIIAQVFHALGPSELIPEQYRQSKVASGYSTFQDWQTVERAWILDDFVIDPTRVTLVVKQGLSGYEMRRRLMDKFGIQVNKVSLNSILLQFNIGTLRSSVSYLLEALLALAIELQGKGYRNWEDIPSAPVFSQFTQEFLGYSNTSAGDLRRGFYAGQEEARVAFVPIHELLRRVRSGEIIAASSITIPVPPGYPALLPGQIVTESILIYLLAIEQSSIIGGYSSQQGLKVFVG